jgi:hypothetical protein
MNAAIVGIRPSKFAATNLFPLPESRVYETLLRKELLQKLPPHIKTYKIANRTYNDCGANYCGDGCFTNDCEVIDKKLKEVGIL